MAVQFLASVGTDATFRNRPMQNPTKLELINYTLQQEIMETANLYSYSGNAKFHMPTTRV